MKGIRIAVASAAATMVAFGAAGAFAADMNMPLKAVPVSGPSVCTSIVDFFTTACQVSAYGVRFYGTYDIGGSYMTNPTGVDKFAGPGVGYFPQKNSGVNGPGFRLAPNALSLSNIGLQVQENIGGGWSFVGQLEAGFLPQALTFANNPGSVQEQIGRPASQQTLGADGAQNGMFYTQLGFAGVSHDTWGTLTFGRQNDDGKDIVLAYDPMGNAYGFSYIGFFGATAAGGDTEDAKETTAFKYRVNIGNWRLAALAQVGGYAQGNASNGEFQGGFGADYHVGPGVLSFDTNFSYTKDAVKEAVGAAPAVNPSNSPNSLAVTISDNTAALFAAKYTWDRLKLYAGYEWIQFAPPSDVVTSFTDESGVALTNGGSLNGLANVVAINNTAFNGQKQFQQTAWVGARYSLTSSLDAAGAYYHADFSQTNPTSNVGAFQANCAANATSNANCHGTVDAFSFLLDWQFAPKWDTYIGTLYTKLGGGQANGFFADNNWATTAGIRFRW